MKKIIAMIPVRLGSKRVPNKNLRLLGNKPLVAHIIEAAKEANVFDEIVINSESDIFKEIADEYGVKFYKRPDHLSTDEATNDDFTLDFMHNINGDMLIQLLATSPFITSTQIKEFVSKSLRYVLSYFGTFLKSGLSNLYNTDVLVLNAVLCL